MKGNIYHKYVIYSLEIVLMLRQKLWHQISIFHGIIATYGNTFERIKKYDPPPVQDNPK